MKKITRRNFVKTVGFSAFATSLAACGAQSKPASGASSASGETGVEVSKSELPIVQEQQELNVLVTTNYPDIDPSEIVILKELFEQTNVKINYEVISATAWPEQKGLVLSRSELPDVIIGSKMFTDADMLNMASAGQIYPVSDYQDYTPNFNKLAELDETLIPTLTAQDGNVWAFPSYVSEQENADGEKGRNIFTTQRVAYINQDWLDELGLPIPTTTDELKATLIAFRDKDPNKNSTKDEIPMSGHQTATYYFDDFFGAFGLDPHASASEIVFDNIAMKDGKVVFSAMEPEYRKALEYFADLWAEGLLDPETFSHDQSMYNAKLKSEEKTVGVCTGWRTTAWRAPGSTDNTTYSVLPTLNQETGGVYHRFFSGVYNRCSMVVTTSCKNPALAMRWLDNMLSDDNSYQFWTGQKIGYNIEMGDEGMFDWILPIDVSDPEFQKQVSQGYGVSMVSTDNQLRNPPATDPLGVDMEKNAADVFYKGTYTDMENIYPKVFFSTEESDKMALYRGEIDMYVDKMYADFITKGVTDDKWNGFIEQLKKMNVEEYIAAYQSAYDRYMSV